MSWALAGLGLGSFLFLLFAIGMPVTLAFFGVNLAGAWVFLGGEAGLEQLVRNTGVSVNSFALLPIPLFVMMGEILFHTGVAYRSINAIDRLLQRVPARLAVVSLAGGTVFAALSGSSIANTALLGGTLSPDMLRRGYSPTLSFGPVMAVGGIAVLIPPSALAVMLGSLSGISISKLLIGGIVPGLLMSLGFLLYILAICWLWPHVAPREQIHSGGSFRERYWPFIRDVMPLSLIFVAVIGGMLSGLATPTEASALGAVASLVATACYGALSLKTLKTSLLETAKVSVSILFIIAASTTFSQILSFSGVTTGVTEVIGSLRLSPDMLVLAMLGLLLLLGCVIDQVSMMLVTLPFFMPLAAAANIDTIWLGLMMLVAIEIGLLTPPFGILLMVMQGAAPRGTPLAQIYRAAFPFIVIEVMVLGLMFAWPVMVNWLPGLLD
ncbi:TRAP transporter large permease subunit [Pseudolabrys sp. FHR47]|uniref:TRAP transporter large permease n=1 Tax=Pseudolabrys sp. FHR47 TaxID=2562284 RepID=UPI0010BEA8A8|nr:TRAP transporter large permease subunit [Pseudolabrys sp. FHR47]